MRCKSTAAPLSFSQTNENRSDLHVLTTTPGASLQLRLNHSPWRLWVPQCQTTHWFQLYTVFWKALSSPCSPTISQKNKLACPISKFCNRQVYFPTDEWHLPWRQIPPLLESHSTQLCQSQAIKPKDLHILGHCSSFLLIRVQPTALPQTFFFLMLKTQMNFQHIQLSHAECLLPQGYMLCNWDTSRMMGRWPIYSWYKNPSQLYSLHDKQGISAIWFTQTSLLQHLEHLKQLHLLRKLFKYCEREEDGCSSRLDDPVPHQKFEKVA